MHHTLDIDDIHHIEPTNIPHMDLKDMEPPSPLVVTWRHRNNRAQKCFFSALRMHFLLVLRRTHHRRWNIRKWRCQKSVCCPTMGRWKSQCIRSKFVCCPCKMTTRNNRKRSSQNNSVCFRTTGWQKSQHTQSKFGHFQKNRRQKSNTCL